MNMILCVGEECEDVLVGDLLAETSSSAALMSKVINR